MITIVLIDDQPLVRAGLRTLLERDPELQVVGEADNGRSGVRLVQQTKPDVVLMDFRLPGLDGAQATVAVKSARPDAVVICLTAEATDDERVAVMAAGADALVEKGAPTSQLVESVRSAFRDAGEHP